MSYPSHLSQFGQHDYNSRVVLPEHSPEVFCSLCQRALRCDVGLLLPVYSKTILMFGLYN